MEQAVSAWASRCPGGALKLVKHIVNCRQHCHQRRLGQYYSAFRIPAVIKSGSVHLVGVGVCEG